MARVIALAAAPLRIDQLELLRTLVVWGCALALILAGNAVPL
jgi:hypothetical protein